MLTWKHVPEKWSTSHFYCWKREYVGLSQSKLDIDIIIELDDVLIGVGFNVGIVVCGMVMNLDGIVSLDLVQVVH